MSEYEKVFSMVAMHYLTEPLPDDWHDWDDGRQNEFVDDHRWELVENWPLGELYDEMESFTSEIIRYANSTKEDKND